MPSQRKQRRPKSEREQLNIEDRRPGARRRRSLSQVEILPCPNCGAARREGDQNESGIIACPECGHVDY